MKKARKKRLFKILCGPFVLMYAFATFVAVYIWKKLKRKHGK